MSSRAVGMAALLLTGCFTTAAPHQHAPLPARTPPRACRPALQRVVDLTHRVHPDMVVEPGGLSFSKTPLVAAGEGPPTFALRMGDDVGTHVEAPRLLTEGPSVDQLSGDRLVVPAAVIDVSKRVGDDADYVIGPDVIVDWEDIHGPIPVRAIVVFHTGWGAKFDDPAAYAKVDADGVSHFPGIGPHAAELLVERGVVGVGIDTLRVDPGASSDSPARAIILGSDAFQIENLAHLDQLPPVGATLIVGVMPIREGTRAPARVVALVVEQNEEGQEEETP